MVKILSPVQRGQFSLDLCPGIKSRRSSNDLCLGIKSRRSSNGGQVRLFYWISLNLQKTKTDFRQFLNKMHTGTQVSDRGPIGPLILSLAKLKNQSLIQKVKLMSIRSRLLFDLCLKGFTKFYFGKNAVLLHIFGE